MRVHLIGICGTAMSALASMLKTTGFEVQGSDVNAYPPVSTLLRDNHIPILKGFHSRNIDKKVDLVVVGNVARGDNPEVVRAANLDIPMLSMPQAIRRFFLRDRFSVVAAGTHGKTTVTSMTSWLLQHAGEDPSYLVGGVPLNFGSNFKIGAGRHFVIEGDEYDTSFFDKKAKFFHYNPSVAVITSLEFDHADIYRDFDHLKETFRQFAGIIAPDGTLVYCADYPVLDEIVPCARSGAVSYGFSAGADYRASRVKAGPYGTRYTLEAKGKTVGRVTVPMWGRHNVLNSLAALTAAHHAGVELETAMEGLSLFKGVMRRFQVVGQEWGVTVLDDFAHHPTAVRETIAATRKRFPSSRVFAAYHFESNTSRRKVFERDYSTAFFGADYVFLTYPLRKQDDLKAEEYLNPHAVMAGIRTYAKDAFAYKDMRIMAAGVASLLRPGDVVIAMSGRDFSPFYETLLPMLKRKSSRAAGQPMAQGLPAS